MQAVRASACRASSSSVVVPRRCSGRASVPRPFSPSTSSSTTCHRRPSVEARFFKFGKNGMKAEDAGIVGSQGRDDFTYDDLEQYFNYMGILATEGTYDRMEGMLKSGLHPIDCILLLASTENDFPKVQEILKAGADVTVKGLDGKRPLELASKPELRALLQEYEGKAKVSA